MIQTIGYAALSQNSPLVPFNIERRALQKDDVHIEVLFCGICHSDLHMIRNEWKKSIYPLVAGHEIIGQIQAIGPAVKHLKIGDLVGVGCIIGSCQACPSCQSNLEQYCDKGYTFVFNSIEIETQNINHGGFSKAIVVKEPYVLKIPSKFQEKDLPRAAPILCAGITTYSPLKHWNIGKGSQVGVIGLGGLGHMAVKIAKALGAHVTVFTTSSQKVPEAKSFGADEAALSLETNSLQPLAGRFDFLLNTVAAPLDLNVYLSLLKREGTMCLVGLPAEPYSSLQADPLIRKRTNLAGSLIGSIQETQEALDFCASHGVLAEIELIRPSQINQALDRMVKNDVKYRFVIDMRSFD